MKLPIAQTLLLLCVLCLYGCMGKPLASSSVEAEIKPPLQEEQVAAIVEQSSQLSPETRPDVGRYARSLLSLPETEVYVLLEELASAYQIDKPTALPEQMHHTQFQKVWSAWQNDYPEYYWAQPKFEEDHAGNITAFSVWIASPLTLEEVKRRQREIDEAAEKLLEGLTGSPFDKACAVHDRLLANTSYSGRAGIDDTANLYGTLVNRQGICNGISRAYQYLAQRCGIETIYISGYTSWGTTHAWNAVRLPGGWYYVDPTWDQTGKPYLFHDYLLASWDEFSAEHLLRPGQYSTLPQENHTAENYYIKNGYFAVNPLDSPEKLAAGFAKALSGKALGSAYEEVFCEIKLQADADAYTVSRDYLIQNVFTVIKWMNKTAREQNLPWEAKETGKVTIDYNNVTKVLSILMEARRI